MYYYRYMYVHVHVHIQRVIGHIHYAVSNVHVHVLLLIHVHIQRVVGKGTYPLRCLQCRECHGFFLVHTLTHRQ